MTESRGELGHPSTATETEDHHNSCAPAHQTTWVKWAGSYKHSNYQQTPEKQNLLTSNKQEMDLVIHPPPDREPCGRGLQRVSTSPSNSSKTQRRGDPF